MATGIFSRRKKDKKRVLERQNKGLCMRCDNKAITKNHCKKHREQENRRALEYFRRKKRGVVRCESGEIL